MLYATILSQSFRMHFGDIAKTRDGVWIGAMRRCRLFESSSTSYQNRRGWNLMLLSSNLLNRLKLLLLLVELYYS